MGAFHRGARPLVYRQLTSSTAVGIGDSTTTLGDTNQSNQALLTNKSGADLSAGAVVIVDFANNESFTTTTTDAETGKIVGVLAEDIANNVAGLVIIGGKAEVVALGGITPSRGDYLYTSAIAGQARSDPALQSGAFGQVIEASANGAAILYGITQETTVDDGDLCMLWPEALATSSTEDHNHTGTNDGGDLDGAVVGDFVAFTEASAPATPPSGIVRVYAKTDGKIYRKPSSGTESELGGTAVGGGGTTLPLDVAPSSPSAWDDEFPGTTLDAKWTNPITSTRTITLAVANSWVTIEPSNAGTGSTGARGGWGIRQNSPTASFRMMAKIANGPSAAGNDDSRIGIWWAAGTTASQTWICGLQDSATRILNVNNLTYSESADWSAFGGSDTIVESGSGDTMIGLAETRLRMDYSASASTLTAYYSSNGVFWKQVTTIASVSQPTRCGIAIWGNLADIRADHRLGCDWFRIEEF